MLYLLRHGDIETNGEKRFIGWTDNPLSRHGRERAVFWGRKLQHIEFSGIWSSPLRRARETADIITSLHLSLPGNTVQTAWELSEINLGTWDGVVMSHIREQHPELWRERGEHIAIFRPPEGESFTDLQKRAVRFITRLAAQSTGDLLIVTHAGVIRVLVCHALSAPLSHLFRIHLNYGGLTLIQVDTDVFHIWAINRSG